MVEKESAETLEVEACLERIDRLLVDDPRAALEVAAVLPILVADLGCDVQARAYSTLGTAYFKTNHMASAATAFQIAEELGVAAGATTRALIKLRRSSLVVLAGRDAARLWLVSTGADRSEDLRDLLLHGKKAGVESD